MPEPDSPAGPSWRLLLLTLLGLVGCALVAVVHPVESYEPGRELEQAGRNLQVHLEITTSRNGDGWARGQALPFKDGHVHPREVSWVWFRPDEPPHPGDRVHGRALLSLDSSGTSLLLDGPRAATITQGPLPIPVHWDTLLAHPQTLQDRLLMVNGEIDGTHLRAPDTAARCPLATTPETDTGTNASRWLLHLQPDPERPGWNCHLEGPA